MERKNLWKTYTEEQRAELFALSEDYKRFLTDSKTERRFVANAIAEAEEQGFFDLDEAIAAGRPLKAGDRFYRNNMNKLLMLGIVGREPMSAGSNILGAHIDSPRMDLKQNPLYEDADMALLDTHYYGGIKKYQWVTVPLALYGVVVKKDGTVVDVAIGDKEDDPVFCVTDLLIHLGSQQMEKKASVVVEGEALDVLIASEPIQPADGGDGKEEAKETVTANVLKILGEQYGIEEEDFLSAEIEVVPAGRTRDMGLDRSMVIGYGQDDRVCAYTSLRAIFDAEDPDRTALCLLTDKEEVGSIGATGMESHFFEDTVAELCALTGEPGDLALRRALRRSCVLSSDVGAAYDPCYAEAFEKKNSAYFGRGVVFHKFTGSRGKSSANDANAEYVGKLRQVMDDAGVGFQTAELGRVDLGGGGTIAFILARYGMNVIDSGVPVLSMHSPWEVTSKADIYEAYRCYKAFLKAMEM